MSIELLPEELRDQGFEEYVEFIHENYLMIASNRMEFIRDNTQTVRMKLERVQELLDFFCLEDDNEKCDVLDRIKGALEIKYVYEENKTIA
jgi:hypothetical protein